MLEELKKHAAEIAKHVILTRLSPDTSKEFNEQFGEIYDFVLGKLMGEK